MNHPGPRLANLLLASYQRLVDDATDELARRGFGDVRPGHHHAMVAIDAGATNASELGRRTGVTKQAALRTVSLLIDRGWIVREDDPEDGRGMRLRVTQLGHDVTEAGAAVFDELRRAWEADIGSQELEELEARLSRFVDGPAREP